MTTRIAINGLGRIGRAFLRRAQDFPDLEVVAVNDLGDKENLAYLLRYDTAYGQLPYEVGLEGDNLLVDKRAIKVFQEKDPANLPWKDMNIDVVIESTGFFTEYEKANAHVLAGAKRVVITAPAKGDASIGGTMLVGVNEGALGELNVTSNASCTTNASSPIITILKESVGIEKALLNTVHAYTASQALVDGPAKKDFRSGRAAAQNIIPSSTGAAIAVTQVHTELAGKFDGIAMRVPVITGSIVDITFVASRDTTVAEINDILRKAAEDPRWETAFTTTDDPIVSSDIVGAPFASIADLSFTRVVGGNLVKVLAWYDNEAGYTETLIRHVRSVSK
ncbi:type I glyceraldehyde-3-phosphate dehydrogenase [Candidatus Kaiserbacteria bacterium RIFCSPHIGHO2_02_FULL_50_50]|uniref:Type I glyceraldehyde-3-phosphate dehydrogenase n=1 Tax=Candidatus Kaiserbacteria bacterium RIFCSPHIGHO2_02_FULL_50_50 TaxID=1798492 RepID=A0A1F6DET0_9BACT|nr:MAG: type I glyceraldehyde-3-phosphate dehydrogenase [Candidatus Kaiserbacteria bacterium RIFCSPHIGHO2_02_FULL_50_50]OGG89247.1 MAG: type I glyceraldehyde-3-phosphate dehydrogenase [Candidatus Kaiserbacteria bacterium RIFCSPLOWO2_12_FULL_50_10]